jgi:hypothetical protein
MVEVSPKRRSATLSKCSRFARMRRRKSGRPFFAEGLHEMAFQSDFLKERQHSPHFLPGHVVDGDLEEQDLFESVTLFFALRVAPAEESAQHVGTEKSFLPAP